MAPAKVPPSPLIFARDLTAESGGNAVGMGNAEVIHRAFYGKSTSRRLTLTPNCPEPHGGTGAHVYASDRAALDLVLGHLGSLDPG